MAMFDEEDFLPKNQKPKPKDLSGLSVEELNEYIARLESEIRRARETIAAKRDVRAGAESLFKK